MVLHMFTDTVMERRERGNREKAKKREEGNTKREGERKKGGTEGRKEVNT